jgi:hypothetical protein
MRMTVLRTAAYLDHCAIRNAYSTYMDIGTTAFSYVLFPYTSASKAEQIADVLNTPPLTLKGTFHDGNLPEVFEGIRASGAVISAIKGGEDGGTIIRLFEANGVEQTATIDLFDTSITVALRPHQLKTLNENGEERDMMEWAVK